MKLNIVGRGNVGSHLYEAFKNIEGIKTDIINPRTLDGLDATADLILISVTDNRLPTVAKNIKSVLNDYNGTVAHTAGSVSMDVFDNLFANFGVFYPLQTFTEGIPLNYREIPVFIEGNNERALKIIREFALLFSDTVTEMSSKGRSTLHLASVFACNFINSLIFAADELLKAGNLERQFLLPLIKQTLNKLNILPPAAAQTGPAVRGDTETINRHLQMLEDKPEYQQLYKHLSESISNNIKK